MSVRRYKGKALRMGEDTDKKMSREERLAARLRENLRRRKAQSRQMAGEAAGESRDSGVSKPDAKS